MPTPISGQNGTYIPPPPGTSTATPGLVRPSDLTGGGSIPNGPQGLTGRPPSFLNKPNTMPPRRNGLPNMHTTQHREEPVMAYPHPGGAGGHIPPQAPPGMAYPYAAPPLPPPGGNPPPLPPPGGNPPPLAEAALSAGQVAGNDAIASQNAMMAQMQQMNILSIQQQMVMGQMEAIKSMATALAKTVKSVGKGVSDLAS